MLAEKFTLPTLTPPGLLNRLRLYSGQYGAVHAVARFASVHVPAIWKAFGPAVSAPYRERWLKEPGAKLLNLGGGGNAIRGALTADIDPRADTYVDVTKRLPFPDGSIDLIFLEEIIEHIDKAQGAALLAECRRVLKAQGVIHLATPDLDWLGSGAASGTVPCDLVNDTFYGHGHTYIYTRAALIAALAEAGFSGARHFNYQDPAAILGFLDSHASRFSHAPELSQYVEAVV